MHNKTDGCMYQETTENHNSLAGEKSLWPTPKPQYHADTVSLAHHRTDAWRAQRIHLKANSEPACHTQTICNCGPKLCLLQTCHAYTCTIILYWTRRKKRAIIRSMKAIHTTHTILHMQIAYVPWCTYLIRWRRASGSLTVLLETQQSVQRIVVGLSAYTLARVPHLVRLTSH